MDSTTPWKRSTVPTLWANSLLGIAIVCFLVRLVFYFYPGVLLSHYGYSNDLLICSIGGPGTWQTVWTLVSLLFIFWAAVAVSCSIRVYALIVSIVRKSHQTRHLVYLIGTVLLALAYYTINELFSF